MIFEDLKFVYLFICLSLHCWEWSQWLLLQLSDPRTWRFTWLMILEAENPVPIHLLSIYSAPSYCIRTWQKASYRAVEQAAHIGFSPFLLKPLTVLWRFHLCDTTQSELHPKDIQVTFIHNSEISFPAHKTGKTPSNCSNVEIMFGTWLICWSFSVPVSQCLR